jgi:hypothetical protein
MTTPVALITGVSAACSPPSAACWARCNRTVSGSPSKQPAGTCSQCKHGWQECHVRGPLWWRLSRWDGLHLHPLAATEGFHDDHQRRSRRRMRASIWAAPFLIGPACHVTGSNTGLVLAAQNLIGPVTAHDIWANTSFVAAGELAAELPPRDVSFPRLTGAS